MSKYTRSEYIKKIRGYFDGELSEDDLYYWNSGFLNMKTDDPLLNKAWVVIHQIHETDPDFKTTTEELKYIHECLLMDRPVSDVELQKARDIGIKKRFAA